MKMLNIYISSTESYCGHVDLNGESFFIGRGQTFFIDEDQEKELKKKLPALSYRILSDTRDKVVELQKKKEQRKADKLRVEIKNEVKKATVSGLAKLEAPLTVKKTKVPKG